MDSIGLRELNQNPSKAVARVRAGEPLLVTDRGRPVLRMIPEVEHSEPMDRLLAAGLARVPPQPGMPDVAPELAPDVSSLADLLVADRERERNR